MGYRIGSGQGYYGDDVMRALPMITGGHVDVVCFEALAELTLAILQKDRLKDPSRGYTFDIGLIAHKILPEAFARKIPIITNGGGLNPLGAAAMVKDVAEKLGLKGLKVAAVTGDDVMGRLDELRTHGEALAHIETGEAMDTEGYVLVNGNVYLGAQPIVEALDAGADIIITGRVADPCLYLAPLIAHYGWAWDDWDRLAGGIVAGHLLECTAQVVGGNSLGVMERIDARDLNKLGYPIADVEANGDFILTKTPDSAGIVSHETVKEQLLYEVHDPANYITPDVVADFTTLSLEDMGDNRVWVRGVTGKPRPSKLKLNFGRLEGYMRELIYTIGYPRAWEKYEQLQAMVDETFRGLAIERVSYSILGVDSLYGGIAPRPEDPIELIVRLMFTAQDEKTLETAVRRMMTNGLSGAAGMSISGTTISGKPRIVLGLFPTLVSRERITPQVTMMEVAI